MDERHGYYLEDISVGMSDSVSKIVTAEDIDTFAQVSGDTNPVHLDEDYAASSLFKQRIAHGMLSASLVSAVFGTRLPGPGCIYMSQSLRFLAPVKIGDEVEARVTVTAVDEDRGRITFETVCTVGDTAVLSGEAMLKVDRKVKVARPAA